LAFIGLALKKGLKPAKLSAQALAAFRTAAGQNLTTVNSGHTGTETVAAGANEAAWLECAFHRVILSFFGIF